LPRNTFLNGQGICNNGRQKIHKKVFYNKIWRAGNVGRYEIRRPNHNEIDAPAEKQIILVNFSLYELN
jgi:hypothetical protein